MEITVRSEFVVSTGSLVSALTSNREGHLTAADDRTIDLPSAWRNGRASDYIFFFRASCTICVINK